MAKIVLAHGILGFGAIPIVGAGVYFNGVAKLYRALGHEVLEPSVAPVGPIDVRSAQLASAIVKKWPGTDDIAIIAHSLGGLDARRVIARDHALGPRIKSLVAISTPHFGTPVADAVLNLGDPLRPYIPGWLLAALQSNAGAVNDLRSRTVLQDPDRAGVKYTEIACDCTGQASSSPLFGLARQIGQLPHHGNDGLVAVTSATVPGRVPQQTWAVDHGEAIGWPSGAFGLQALSAAAFTPRDHLDRFRHLLSFI